MAKVTLVILVGTLLLLTSLPVLAEKPTIQVLPFPSEGMVAPTASLCGFDILATLQAGRPNGEKIILFANTGIVTGPWFLTLKNLTSGRTVDVNVSGPALLTFAETGMTQVGMGPGMLLLPPPPVEVTRAAGLPSVPLFHGRVVMKLDQQGNLLSFQSHVGKVQDVCELLR